MSSYLTFYIVPKEEGSKPISLLSYSRSNEIYQYVNDAINPAYAGLEGETQYTELTKDRISRVIEDLESDIRQARTRVSEYERHAAGNFKVIEEIISQKEYIKDLENALITVKFIEEIVEEADKSWSDYDKVLCNVD